MPTISQLPTAAAVTAADIIPISQGGAAKSVPVGTILQSAQPAITIDTGSLLGRTSLGAGGPEQVDVGQGLTLTGTTLCANGLDHASFPTVGTLAPSAELVISNQGTPMLMAASLLRGLFTAGQNVSITPAGIVSAVGSSGGGGATDLGSAIGALQVTTKLAGQDLVPVSQSGAGRAISYANLLGGLTIDQAQTAGAAQDTDTFWVAQTSNVMTRQTLSAVWAWIMGKLPGYTQPVLEVTTNISLNAAQHNGRILLCSQPVTITPSTANMGSGFGCTVINASGGSVTLGSGFVTANGAGTLGPWQSAGILCLGYSGGMIAFASCTGESAAMTVPGPAGSVTGTAAGPTSISVSWQPPSAGGAATAYSVGYRVTGSSSWTFSAPITATAYQITSLNPATSYDVVVQASNAAGSGPLSSVVTLVTANAAQASPPPQVTGVAVGTVTAASVQLSWNTQSGASAATSYTVQYRVSGTTSWTGVVSGVTTNSATVSGLLSSTTYDFGVIGTNAAGNGPASATVTTSTSAAPQAVTSITWNLVPNGSFSHGVGAIGVNAHISPASAVVQFGFSTSATIPPASWTTAINVNTDLWGAYVPTPPTPGNWYVWCEGTDGSSPTVYPTPFTVS